MARITSDESQNVLLNIAFNLGLQDIGMYCSGEIYKKENYLVFLNGLVIGIHRNPEKFLQELRYMRRKG